MTLPWLGDAMALSCSLVWAISVLLLRRLHNVHPIALNLFKNAVATVLLLFTMLVAGIHFDLHRSLRDWTLLISSGVLGLSVADSLFLAGLRRVDASVVAVADCAFSPTVIVVSTVWLHEVPRAGFVWGAPLVMLGLLMVAWQPGHGGKVDPRGLALVLGGVMTTAVGVVLAKPALDHSGLVEATTVRLIAGSLALLATQVARGRTREVLVLFRPQPLWRVAIPAVVMATYVSMLLWLGGMKYGAASRAALLNQTSVIILMVLTWLMGEKVPARRWAGMAVAVAGVVVVLTR